MKNVKAIIGSHLILFVGLFLSRYIIGFVFLWTLILPSFFIVLLNESPELHLRYKFIIFIELIIAHDILVKVVLLNPNDKLGPSLYSCILIFGIFCSLFTIIYIYRKQISELLKYKISIIFSMLFLIVYLAFTQTMKKTGDIIPSRNINESKENGIFLSMLPISKDIITIDKDTLRIKEGWIEEQQKLSFKGPFLIKEHTGKKYWILKIAGNYLKYLENENNRFIYENMNYRIHSNNNLNLLVSDTCSMYDIHFVSSKNNKIQDDFIIKIKNVH